MANDTLTAKVELVIDQSSVNKELDKSQRQLKQKLNNLGNETGKAASNTLSQNINRISGQVERFTNKTSRLMEKGLKFGLGLGTASIVAFLKSGTADAAKFQTRLDGLKGSIAKVGEKLAFKINFGGKNLADWITTIDYKLSNLTTSQLEKIVDIGKEAVGVWAGLKIFQGVAGGVQAITGITSLVKNIRKETAISAAGSALAGVGPYAAGAAGSVLRAAPLSTGAAGSVLRAAPLSTGAAAAIQNVKMFGGPLGSLKNLIWESPVAKKIFESIVIPLSERGISLKIAGWTGVAGALGGPSAFAQGGVEAARYSYRKNISGMTAGFSDIPGIESKVRWIVDVAKQFTSNLYNAYKPMAEAGFKPSFQNISNIFKYLFGEGKAGVTTENISLEELKKFQEQNKGIVKARENQRISDRLVDKVFEFQKGEREYGKISQQISDKYPGELPLGTKLSSLYGRENIMGRITDYDKTIAEFEAQLKDAPKEIQKTLYGLLDELKAGRSDLIEKRNDVVNSYIEQQTKENDVRDKLQEFTKKRLDLEEDFTSEQKKQRMKMRQTTLGQDVTSIPKLISESLSSMEEERIKRDEDLVEYNKKIADLAEERKKFEEETSKEQINSLKTIEKWLQEITSNTDQKATSATGLPILAY